jgi:DNA repair exonuclease SbcCD ATPase subunit
VRSSRIGRAKGKRVIERLASSPNKPSIDGTVVAQEDVEALLDLSFPVFCQTVLFGQGQPLFYDLDPKGKMLLFQEVLNLERWQKRSDAADAEFDQLAAHIYTVEAEVDRAQAALDENKKLETQLTEQANAWAAERREQLGAAEKLLKLQKARIAELQARIDEADLAYDSAQTELKPLLKEEREMIGGLHAHEHAISLFRHQHQALEREQKELIELRKLSRDFCPTCAQPLKGKVAKQAQADLDRQLADITTKLKGSAKAQKEGEQQLRDFAATCERMQAAARDFENKVTAARATREMHNPELITLKAKVQHTETLMREREEQVNPFRAQLKLTADAQKQLAGVIKEGQTNLEKLNRSAERAKFWIKGFKDVRLYVIEEVLAELEVTTNAILEDMGLPGWSVQYGVERETASGGVQRGITVVINGQDGTGTKPVNFSCWSGGEAQRLRLAGAMALSEVLLDRAGVTTNIEILDEPTRSMTVEGARDLTSYLAERAEYWQPKARKWRAAARQRWWPSLR